MGVLDRSTAMRLYVQFPAAKNVVLHRPDDKEMPGCKVFYHLRGTAWRWRHSCIVIPFTLVTSSSTPRSPQLQTSCLLSTLDQLWIRHLGSSCLRELTSGQSSGNLNNVHLLISFCS